MTALLRTDDGALWVPVAGAGLGYLRSDWRDVAQFSRSGGVLEGDFYRALAPANGGGVWLDAYNGVIEHIDAAGEIAAFGDEVRERRRARWEVHKSELQSIISTSYAVFCL